MAGLLSCLLPQDDIMHPDRIQVQYQLLQDSPYAVSADKYLASLLVIAMKWDENHPLYVEPGVSIGCGNRSLIQSVPVGFGNLSLIY